MSNQMKTTLAAVAAAAVIVLVVIAGTWASAHNTEVGLRAQFTARQKANESSFDKVWKIIQQSAQVSQKERESFRETYVEIMQNTKGVVGEGKLASFFTQAQINVDSSLFRKLMTTVESQRESFHRDQETLLDIVAQHTKVRTEWPSSIFVGDREPLEARIVTSARADEAFLTGQENEVKLFDE